MSWWFFHPSESHYETWVKGFQRHANAEEKWKLTCRLYAATTENNDNLFLVQGHLDAQYDAHADADAYGDGDDEGGSVEKNDFHLVSSRGVLSGDQGLETLLQKCKSVYVPRQHVSVDGLAFRLGGDFVARIGSVSIGSGDAHGYLLHLLYLPVWKNGVNPLTPSSSSSSSSYATDVLSRCSDNDPSLWQDSWHMSMDKFPFDRYNLPSPNSSRSSSTLTLPHLVVQFVTALTENKLL
jgi:hypothetical protein